MTDWKQEKAEQLFFIRDRAWKGLVQIMPADGWYTVLVEASEDGEDVYMPLAAWGLTADGQMVPVDNSGADPRTARNWLGIVHKSNVPEEVQR